MADGMLSNISSSPKGLRGDRTYKTTEYQLVKFFRAIFYGLALATKAIAILIRDVFKGIVGK